MEKMQGCLWRLSKFSPQHNRRVGECKHSDVEPMELTCPACRTDKPRSHDGHTFEPGCRHALTSSRTGTPKGVRERTAPRAARMPAHEDPTGSLRQEQSEEVIIPSQDASRGEVDLPDDGPAPGASSSSSSARQGRGPDLQPRELAIRTVEADSQTPALLDDWTKFDLQAVLRELHFGTDAQKRRLVRKLHLRWWHSGTTTMTKLLHAAGAPKDVIDMVGPIVDTCRICRTWAKPTACIASGRLITAFNEEVEGDIVFVRFNGVQHQFLHLVDRAVKWCATSQLADSHTETLLSAIDTAWVSIYGPMKTLITDGEGGLDNDQSTWYFQVRGIEKKTAAVGQHPRVADRRVQILRSSIHKIMTQLHHDGVAMPFNQILAQATFVINALSTVSGVSPYVAVFGRSPALLPEVGPRLVNDDRNVECPIAGAARVRTLAVQTITEESARQRLRTALKTPTRPAGEEMELQPGDSVEYYREPTSRDLSGWRGPATVVDVTRLEHGRVGIRTNTDQVLNCRTQDVRHRLAYLSELCAPRSSHAGQAQAFLQKYLEKISPGSHLNLGQIKTSEGVRRESPQNNKHRIALQAALYIAQVMFQLVDVVGVRIARGVKSLPERPDHSRSVFLWWLHPSDRNIRYLDTSETKVFTPGFADCEWSSIRMVQYLCDAQGLKSQDELWRIQQDSQPEQPQPSEPPAENPQQISDRLSTIPEETEEQANEHDSSDNEPHQVAALVEAYFGSADQLDAEDQLPLAQAAQALRLEENTQQSSSSSRVPHVQSKLQNTECSEICWHSVCVSPGNVDDGLNPIIAAVGVTPISWMPPEVDDTLLDCDEVGIYVALEAPEPFDKVVMQSAEPIADGDTAELRCYETHVRKAVIDHSDDLLTPEEMKANAEKCLEAMHRELKTWHDLKCISRKPCSQASCIIDTRWVFKWKYVAGVRTIRARLTLRGFKEGFTEGQVNYAATATK